jgi:ribosome-associated toxin RatA of RatAB toxin-antitoxin module
MAVARAATHVPLQPQEAYDLWTDVARWPTFIDGFAHPERLDDTWPEEGARLMWRGVPGGRGAVTERVARAQPPALHEVTVMEEKLDGTQRATFTPAEDGTLVELELDYKVSVGGPLRPLVDVLFIRRAQNDALARTLRRFATEAAEQAAL